MMKINIEEARRGILNEYPIFKNNEDYIELYFYHLFKDPAFLTEDLKNISGKPSKQAIYVKTTELVVMMGMVLVGVSK